MQAESDILSPAVPQLLAERFIPPTIKFPENYSQRIKYTCFDVSNYYLIFGANSGGLYIFNRDSCEFIQLIPNNEGAITKVKISPNEKYIAFSTQRGIICICNSRPDTSNGASPISHISKEHHGNEVTCMVWNESNNELFVSDDVGLVSILYVTTSIAKHMFQVYAFSLMKLESRIVQLDIKGPLLLVSTLTKCFICDTIKETYAQIGQKLRDGEYGACFYNEATNDNLVEPNINQSKKSKISKVFNIISGEEQQYNMTKLEHLKIFCARPGSRFWEVKSDGTVICTHQFKQLLAIPPSNVVTVADFENDNFDYPIETTNYDAQVLVFSKVIVLQNKYILSYTKEGIYIFDPKRPSVVLWTDKYKDIIECKVLNELIYIWRANSTITLLAFNMVDNFLLRCYTHQKYRLCAQTCAFYASSVIDSIESSTRLYLIAELGEKLVDMNLKELRDKILPLLEIISKIKKCNGQKLKSGIVVVENSYITKATLDESPDGNTYKNLSSLDSENKTILEENDSVFQINSDPVKVIKDFGDKLSLGTQKLMKKWNNLEDKVKKIGSDKTYNAPLDVRTNETETSNLDCVSVDNCNQENIVYNENNESEIKCGEKQNEDLTLDETTKTIYRLIQNSNGDSDFDVEIYNILSDICDMKHAYQVIRQAENYMISLGNSVKYSNYKCGKHFLHYINKIPELGDVMDFIIANDEICSYFLQTLININSNSNCASCYCGYPLPTARLSQAPEFSEILDLFIEKRWRASQSEQCYKICQKVPYMWRKILFLRKNEDLVNLLILILQMLDEELLYSYLPKFTVETWKTAVKLFGTLKNQQCLNCGEKFEFPRENNSYYKSILNWDSISNIMLKTIGYYNTPKILKMYSDFILTSELSLKFYHTCLFLKFFEKYNATINCKLIDTIYKAYEYEDAIIEMSSHLKNCLKNGFPHTALPLVVASKSKHWGLKIDTYSSQNQLDILGNLVLNSNISINNNKSNSKSYQIGMNLEETLEHLEEICPNKACYHCCLSLSSNVLIIQNGLWVFSCGHTFHGVCLSILQVKLCPVCIQAR